MKVLTRIAEWFFNVDNELSGPTFAGLAMIACTVVVIALN